MNTIQFNRKYLLTKWGLFVIPYTIIMFLFRCFDRSYSLPENIRFSLGVGVLFLLIMYFWYSYRLKKAEKITFLPSENETILEEKIAVYHGNSFFENYGKLFKTSQRLVFQSTKKRSVEMPLSEIASEESKKTFFANMLKINKLSGEKFSFEIYS